MDKYRIYFNGNKICPKCSGRLVDTCMGLTFRCIDCKSVFRCKEEGYAEREMIVEDVTKEESLCNV